MKLYADNRQGALRCVADSYQKSFIKELDLDTCKMGADPYVEGVWYIDSMKSGHRVVIFLGGCKDSWGNVRKFTDMEEGGIPFKDARRYYYGMMVTKKQLKKWIKYGNLTEDEMAEICK